MGDWEEGPARNAPRARGAPPPTNTDSFDGYLADSLGPRRLVDVCQKVGEFLGLPHRQAVYLNTPLPPHLLSLQPVCYEPRSKLDADWLEAVAKNSTRVGAPHLLCRLSQGVFECRADLAVGGTGLATHLFRGSNHLRNFTAAVATGGLFFLLKKRSFLGLDILFGEGFVNNNFVEP